MKLPIKHLPDGILTTDDLMAADAAICASGTKEYCRPLHALEIKQLAVLGDTSNAVLVKELQPGLRSRRFVTMELYENEQ